MIDLAVRCQGGSKGDVHACVRRKGEVYGGEEGEGE